MFIDGPANFQRLGILDLGQSKNIAVTAIDPHAVAAVGHYRVAAPRGLGQPHGTSGG
jgi:hypothetical protein